MLLSTLATTAMLLPIAASAQSRQRPALVVGAPTFIGVLIPLSGRMSLRPDITYVRQTFSFAGSLTSESLGIGISTLHYLSDSGDVRSYITPRIGQVFLRYSEGGAPRYAMYQLSAAFGAEATIRGRFRAFAEAGIEMGYNESENGGILVINRRWASETRVGATIGF